MLRFLKACKKKNLTEINLLIALFPFMSLSVAKKLPQKYPSFASGKSLQFQVSEKENRMLKQLLTSTRDELQNATQHLNMLSAEFGNMKCLQDEYTGLLFLFYYRSKQ